MASTWDSLRARCDKLSGQYREQALAFFTEAQAVAADLNGSDEQILWHLEEYITSVEWDAAHDDSATNSWPAKGAR